MLLLLALSLVCLTSLFVVACVKPAEKPAAWIIFFLSNYAQIVVLGELGSLLTLLNQKWFFMLGHLLLAGIMGVFWLRAGRPELFMPLLPKQGSFTFGRLFVLAKEKPDLALLTLMLGLAVIYSAVLIVVVPPNNNDALRFHLARVGFWLQHGTMLPWATVMTQQIYSSVNGSLQFLWLILFTGHDKFTGFVQWSSVLATVFGIYGIARWFGWRVEHAYFAALCYLCYPIVLLQMTSTQMDMIATALIVGAVYLILVGLRDDQPALILFSALGLALGLGTKQTLFYLMPGFGIFLVSLLLKYKTPAIKVFVKWGVMVAAGFIIFSCYINVINWQTYGNPAGANDIINTVVGTRGLQDVFEDLRLNSLRTLYNALDTSGLPRPIDGYVHKLKAYALGATLEKLAPNLEGTYRTYDGYPFRLSDKTLNQEDSAWFGWLGVFLLLPALVRQVRQDFKQRDFVGTGLVLMLSAFFFSHMLLWSSWSPYVGRYFTPAVATATPLIAGLNWDDRRGKVLRWLLVSLSVVTIFVTVLYNPAKQTLGKQAKWVDIWTADRATAMTIQSFGDREMMLMVQDKVPVDTTLGVAHTGSMNQYGLFGEGLTRRLLPVYPIKLTADANWLDQQGISYLLVENVPDIPAVPDTFKLISQVEGWRLYQRR